MQTSIKLITLFLLNCWSCQIANGNDSRGLNPIQLNLPRWGGPKPPLTTLDIILSSGYPVETHTTITQDGYILELYRILPTFFKDNGKTLPVLITHGNLESSADWVMNTPKNMSFPMMLSDAGYDVWLGNHRGTPQSRYHKTMNNNSRKYWDFGMHEEGVYDFPAMIDHIISITGKPKVRFVSLSMGTTLYCIGLSSRPEYNEKIGIGILMGPTVYMTNFLNGLAYFSAIFYWRIYHVLLKVLGPMPILPYSAARIVNNYFTNLCDPQVDLIEFCRNYYGLVHGVDKILTQDQLPEIMAVAPAGGSSLKITAHILQIAAARNKFPMFNYGRRKNLMVYGTVKPPEYNLSKVTAPTAVFVGRYDILGNVEDAKTLSKKLSNLVELYIHPYERFNHLDFLYGREEAIKMYRHVMELFNLFNL